MNIQLLRLLIADGLSVTYNGVRYEERGPSMWKGHRGHCPSTVSPDLADPAPGSPLRRTRPSCHSSVKEKAPCENDSATPESQLSHRITPTPIHPSACTV